MAIAVIFMHLPGFADDLLEGFQSDHTNTAAN
jgi:hypothetical protein